MATSIYCIYQKPMGDSVATLIKSNRVKNTFEYKCNCVEEYVPVNTMVEGRTNQLVIYMTYTYACINVLMKFSYQQLQLSLHALPLCLQNHGLAASLQLS